MKRRSIVALSIVAVVAAAFTAATSGANKQATASSITVWLQIDAQSGWSDVVAAASQKFQADHPGTTVNVQYQNWGDHLQKFDATLAGGGGPDVIEMGNTEMTKYMAAGAFSALDKSSFENSATWLKGLAASGAYGGKTYGVPYYAGSRVVTYRSDLFKKAGISKLPSTTAQYIADAKKLLAQNKKKGFSPVYIAGTDWYVAMGFVFDYGGGIAQQVSGKWKGLLASPKSLAGLAAYKNFYLATSRASKTTDETHPNPYDVYAQGEAASMIGPSWFSCCVGKKFTGATAQFVMPGHVKGQAIPGFLGGSHLAVPTTSSNRSLIHI
jgi:N,N'-diacetylchitobiose transport system substrate-binding protein